MTAPGTTMPLVHPWSPAALTPWIGLDPGAVNTGIALRLGSRCLAWHTTRRADDETEIGPGPIYYAAINRAVAVLAGASVKGGFGAPRIAIEGVRPPGGFRDGKKQFAKPVDILALGATFGALHLSYPDAVIVPPGGNGRGVYSQYPENLVSVGEQRAKNWRVRECGTTSPESHARSAWMVAGKAERMARLAA